MTNTKILAITLDPFWASALAMEAKNRGITVEAITANTLMEAYNIVESQTPHFAVVDDEFSKLPEFSMIKSMFAILGTRWMLNRLPARTRNRSMSDLAGKLNLTVEVIDFLFGKQISTQGPAAPTTSKNEKVVVLGASTGGIEALTTILPRLPSDCPPTVVVQHTGKNFGDNLIDLLARTCSANVARVFQGEKLTRGMIRIAAGIEYHCHLSQKSHFETKLVKKAPLSGHLPSIDELFKSAIPFANKIIAGLLTGMGCDGADGLLQLRKAGAKTFCQDKKSSVVYGMPRIAWETGAAETKIPLDLIASHITRNS